jgi:hypothetical protein
MTQRSGPHPPRRYELKVQGHLDDRWAAWFDADVMTRDADATTMSITVADQAQLHGLLAKVRDLGATLISVTATAQHFPSAP